MQNAVCQIFFYKLAKFLRIHSLNPDAYAQHDARVNGHIPKAVADFH